MCLLVSGDVESVLREVSSAGFEPVPLLHLTLVFLGSVMSHTLAAIRRELASAELPEVRRLRVVGLELLPPHKKTNLCLLVELSDELAELRRRVLEICRRHVDVRDEEFLPHVTVARRRRVPPSDVVERVMRALRHAEIPRELRVEGLALVRSFRGRYEILLRR